MSGTAAQSTHHFSGQWCVGNAHWVLEYMKQNHDSERIIKLAFLGALLWLTLGVHDSFVPGYFKNSPAYFWPMSVFSSFLKRSLILLSSLLHQREANFALGFQEWKEPKVIFILKHYTQSVFLLGFMNYCMVLPLALGTGQISSASETFKPYNHPLCLYLSYIQSISASINLTF